jgi:hypothetical protein
MAEDSTVNDVFRFVQLRPQRTVPESRPIPLRGDTALVKQLAGAGSVSKRAEVANAALTASAVKSVGDVPLGPEIVAALLSLREKLEATTADLRQKLPDLDGTLSGRDFNARLEALSDTLLAAYFATEGFPADLRALQNVYRVYHLPPANASEPLAPFIARPLLAPAMPRDQARRQQRSAATTQPQDTVRAAVSAAIEELARLDRRDLLEQPDAEGRARGNTVPFTLTAAARASVSTSTATLLRERGIDLAHTSIDIAVQTLAAEKGKWVDRPIKWPRPVVEPQPGVTLPPPPVHALVKPSGVADLLVVKQQIKRYEGGEIAHVENVLIGEKKSRAHRRLERSEETFVSETETTRTQETELETADRFELNRETSRTIENDQKHGFGLSLSGKYGPSVEFSSTFTAEGSSSQEESTKNSSRYAKDVVSRSLERLTERVREMRTRTIVRETEETNLHELHNEIEEHVSGIYQFLDKVYEAQVFNYGIRQMFDFIIPEPASFWWYVTQNPTLDVDLPAPPPKLESLCPNASFLNDDFAIALAAEFGAKIDPAPPLYTLITVGFNHGQDNSSEENQPSSVQRADLPLPAGYRPLRARIRVIALTDENPVIAIAIGRERVVWEPGATVDLGHDDYKLAHQPTVGMNLDAEPYGLSAESKLSVSIIAYETNTYSIEVAAVAQRTEELLQQWKVATFDKIRAAYEDRVREHEQKVEALRAEAEARAERENRMPFGAPPAVNRQTVNTELKKHCISMITEQRYDAFDATKSGAPPYFDFVEAAAEGAYIRFFEQAFEWDQIQYVFYPYFWSRKSTWIDRFTKQEVDPVFLEFLRAGSARVVVPVRPGFEYAVTHFIETGKLWGGEEEPPQINTPLYVSIIDEIRERTGAPRGEKPMGEPWDVRVPTALVLVRPNSDLPKWKRTAPGEWSWVPDEGTT